MNDYAVTIWIRGQEPIANEFKAVCDPDAVRHAFVWATAQGFRKMRRTDPVRANGAMTPGYFGEGQKQAAWLQVAHI